jgi:probable rRNA maturation factor
MQTVGITLANRQRKLPLRLEWLTVAVERANTLTAQEPDADEAQREWPEEIEVTLISDRRMAALHVAFMGIKGPTDVLTFQHGEIVISAETAARSAAEFGHFVEYEIVLYVVHGLLHLKGYDDLHLHARNQMERVQTRLWKQLLREMEPLL